MRERTEPTPQEVADLRRDVRRLVESASGDALEEVRGVLEAYAAQEGESDPFVPAEPLPRAERERRLDELAAMTQDMGGHPELDRPPPTIAEVLASRPFVSIPARYCGPDCYGVRVGRLVEDRDGMAQVQVAGYGVVNVPSAEVER